MLEADSAKNEFNIFRFSEITRGNDLSSMMYYLFEKNHFFEVLNIEIETFIRFAR